MLHLKTFSLWSHYYRIIYWIVLVWGKIRRTKTSIGCGKTLIVFISLRRSVQTLQKSLIFQSCPEWLFHSKREDLSDKMRIYWGQSHPALTPHIPLISVFLPLPCDRSLARLLRPGNGLHFLSVGAAQISHERSSPVSSSSLPSPLSSPQCYDTRDSDRVCRVSGVSRAK